MFAVFAVDYYGFGGRENWDFSEVSPARVAMVVPWLLGFAAYQLVNPGSIDVWVTWWTNVDQWLHFTPQTWMSASALSFVVAAVVTVPVSLLSRRARRTNGTPRDLPAAVRS